MDFFADEATVAALKSRLDGASAAPAEVLSELAWYLRQRDTRQALALADQIDAGPLIPDVIRVRTNLVRAEVAMLFGDLLRARNLLATAESISAACGDACGEGDTHLLSAALAHGQGDLSSFHAHTEQAAHCFARAGDRRRQRLADAFTSLARVYADPRMDDHMARQPGDDGDAAVAVLLGLASALRSFQAGDNAQAAAELTRLLGPAESAGMVQMRLHIGVSLSAALSNLDDKHAALECLERTLELARETGWPLVIGDALALLGNLTCEMGQPERAITLLKEAQEWLSIVPDARANAIVSTYLGHAELSAGQVEEALRHAEAGRTTLSWAVRIDATLLAARALRRLGKVEEAKATAQEAVVISEQHNLPVWHVEALRTLAEIHVAHPTLGEEQMPLSLLERARSIVDHLGGHAEAVALLNQLSHAYEAAGDMSSALTAERQARSKASRAERKRVDNLLTLLEMRHKSERERADAEHQRDLARAEAARAHELESSLDTLESLGRIGREIIANLELSNVLNALVTHLGKLMHVSYVGMSVLESNGRLMVRRGIEEGEVLPERRVSLDDPNSLAAQSARERREILTEWDKGARNPSHIPGTKAMGVAWFGPLLVSDELVGVLTIQSSQKGAYGEREQLILRTLSAYVAVAVANARAYTRLGEQHARLMLVEAEMRRLATTDALTNIPNRRQFLIALRNESRRVQRTGRPISVVMGDIDHFKTINDTFGHAAGDHVLARVARILENNKRGMDTVGRLGGEEFALLLPETDIQQAAEVADRLRSLIASDKVVWEGRPIPVTMSFGCAMLDATTEADGAAGETEAVLQFADRALYYAKDAGRNQTALLRDGVCGLIEPLAGAE